MMDQKLLIVDDQDELRHMLRIALGYGKYVMFEATTAGEAIEAFQRERPEVVLLDVMMPGDMNGFGACRRIKQFAAENDFTTYVAMITAREHPADIEEGRSAGADIYVVKPFSPMRLVEIIESRAGNDGRMQVIRPGR